MKVTYISIWDNCTEVSTSCNYNVDSKCVTGVESSDIKGVDVLTEEYIELPNGVTIDRKDFFLEGEDF
jgi:hypothetical protein